MAKLIREWKFFFSDADGNFGILTALILVPLMIAAGAMVDLSTATDLRFQAQNRADAAALAAAAMYSKGAVAEKDLEQTASAYLSTGSGSSMNLMQPPYLSADKTQLCVDVASESPTTLMRVAAIEQINVSVTSCAALAGQTEVEVALVLDVSSSMVEQNRFTQMQEAVRSFLTGMSNSGGHARIAMVPFSSRISIGMTRNNWLRPYGGNPAVPPRWLDPSRYHSSATISKWVDGVTNLATTATNYYWMGCIEPRADVEMRDSGVITTASLADDPPSGSRLFVPMDSNPGSGKSFCPPPITPLTDDFGYLQNVINRTTSEGSTRLDAGILGGWYVLSPRWAAAWGPNAPADYANKTKKVIVFMTDGGMNAKYGPEGDDKLDWICTNNRTPSCNDTANNAFLSTCSAIKAAGIGIYTISYSPDADVSNLRRCSSGANYHYSASSSSIEAVYTAISREIISSTLRLTQ